MGPFRYSNLLARSGTNFIVRNEPIFINRHLWRLAHIQSSLLVVKYEEMSQRQINIYSIDRRNKKVLGISSYLNEHDQTLPALAVH